MWRDTSGRCLPGRLRTKAITCFFTLARFGKRLLRTPALCTSDFSASENLDAIILFHSFPRQEAVAENPSSALLQFSGSSALMNKLRDTPVSASDRKHVLTAMAQPGVTAAAKPSDV